MSVCPQCGLDPAATTQNATTGKPYYECDNGHMWADEDGGEADEELGN